MTLSAELTVAIDALTPHVVAVALVSARLLPVAFLCPLLGGSHAPTHVKLGVVLALNLQQLVHGLENIVGFKFLDARVYFISDLPARVRVGDVARICGFAFVLACLSTLYPAARAARLLPAESLRND